MGTYLPHEYFFGCWTDEWMGWWIHSNKMECFMILASGYWDYSFQRISCGFYINYHFKCLLQIHQTFYFLRVIAFAFRKCQHYSLASFTPINAVKELMFAMRNKEFDTINVANFESHPQEIIIVQIRFILMLMPHSSFLITHIKFYNTQSSFLMLTSHGNFETSFLTSFNIQSHRSEHSRCSF